MNKSTIISTLVVVVVVVVGLVLLQNASNKPSKYTELATCLAEKGATFYGAFWCPNCGNQKKLFGTAADILPYVECSTPDGKGQQMVCTEKGIASYPTWEFADGSRLVGTQDLEVLAEKAGCPMPSDAPAPAAENVGEASGA